MIEFDGPLSPEAQKRFKELLADLPDFKPSDIETENKPLQAALKSVSVNVNKLYKLL